MYIHIDCPCVKIMLSCQGGEPILNQFTKLRTYVNADGANTFAHLDTYTATAQKCTYTYIHL